MVPSDDQADLAKQIGRRLTDLRGSRSQESFASLIGVHKNTLGRYERGIHLPDAKVLADISRVCCVSIEWIVTGSERFQDRNEFGPVPVENLPLERIVAWLREWWATADPKRRAWLEVELERHFPELAEWQKKQDPSSKRQSGA